MRDFIAVNRLGYGRSEATLDCGSEPGLTDPLPTLPTTKNATSRILPTRQNPAIGADGREAVSSVGGGCAVVRQANHSGSAICTTASSLCLAYWCADPGLPFISIMAPCP